MVWPEQKDRFTDCYFCMTKISGFSKKTRSQIKYPDCLSAMKPVLHSLEYPVPQPPCKVALDLKFECSADAATSSASESDFYFEEPTEETTEVPHLISQGELQDLARDLCLSKEKSELLGSRLKQWNLLQKGANTTIFRKKHLVLASYFCLEDDICFCKDISGLMLSLDQEYKADEWRLFIDSNKTSLKAVLLHNGNQKPSVPVAYSGNTTETYHAMKKLLMCIHCDDHKWHICGDLKVIGLLLALQLGYTKYMCFLCLWDSQADKHHYSTTEWPSCTNFNPGKFNVQYIPLVEPSKVFLPPLHIKLGLFKNFVKAMDMEGEGFKYIGKKFPYKSEAKLKQGIFVGPEIRKLVKDEELNTKLNAKELAAWEAFKLVVQNFLGKHKAVNCKEIVNKMLNAYQEMGA